MIKAIKQILLGLVLILLLTIIAIPTVSLVVGSIYIGGMLNGAFLEGVHNHKMRKLAYKEAKVISNEKQNLEINKLRRKQKEEEYEHSED